MVYLYQPTFIIDKMQISQPNEGKCAIHVHPKVSISIIYIYIYIC